MTSTPSTSIAPAVGRMRPISMRMVVLLPEPLAPRKAKIEPAATSIERSSTAVKVPKRLVSPRVRMIGPARTQPPALEVEQRVCGGRFVGVAGADEDERRRPRALEQRPDLGARHHVDARRRLVEDEQRGPRQERVGDRQLLLHAPRERARRPVGERGEPRAREQLARARAELRLRQAVEARREAQVLLDRQVAVEAEGLRAVADARLERRHVAAQIVAEDGRLAGLDLAEPCQRAQERRLPGAVGPDDAHDLAPLEHEIDAAERAPAAVALLEGAEPDHGWKYTLPSVPGWRRSTPSRTRTLAR